MKTKICSTCKIEKSVTEFNKQSRSKDGLKKYCRSCASLANKKCRANGKGKTSTAKTAKRAELIDQGKKVCPTCKQLLVLEAFGVDNRDKNGIMVNCKNCESKRAKQYYPAQAKTEGEQKQRAHYFGMATLKTRYGITEVDFQSMMNEQKGCCAICEKDFGTLITRAHVDHCHKTGNVRGLLCPTCNMILGVIETNEHQLHKIVEYKNKYE